MHTDWSILSHLLQAKNCICIFTSNCLQWGQTKSSKPQSPITNSFVHSDFTGSTSEIHCFSGQGHLLNPNCQFFSLTHKTFGWSNSAIQIFDFFPETQSAFPQLFSKSWEAAGFSVWACMCNHSHHSSSENHFEFDWDFEFVTKNDNFCERFFKTVPNSGS